MVDNPEIEREYWTCHGYDKFFGEYLFIHRPNALLMPYKVKVKCNRIMSRVTVMHGDKEIESRREYLFNTEVDANQALLVLTAIAIKESRKLWWRALAKKVLNVGESV
jgi:hypothetical protein